MPVVISGARPVEASARVEVSSKFDVERIARMAGVPLLENESIWFCVVDGTLYVAYKRKRGVCRR